MHVITRVLSRTCVGLRGAFLLNMQLRHPADLFSVKRLRASKSSIAAIQHRLCWLHAQLCQ